MNTNLSRLRVLAVAVLLGFLAAPSAHAQLTTLRSFTGGADGAFPYGPVLDLGGALYGTTLEGGTGTVCTGDASGCGTVYRLTPPASGATPWQKTRIWSFTGGAGGASPWSGLVADPSGALYGATGGGGSTACTDGCGTIFRLSPPSGASTAWTRTTLVSFPGGAAGSFPQGPLVRDASGALYGTTWDGGANGCIDCGTVFKVSPPAAGQTAWQRQTLWRFRGTDGLAPNEGLLVTGSGVVYGTTDGGGRGCDTWGCGTVFRLSPPAAGQTAWTLTTLKKFGGAGDGEYPVGYPVQDGAGALYVATQDRSTVPCQPRSDCGHVVKLTPPASGQTAWTATKIYTFVGGIDGEAPTGTALARDTAGNLYGSTSDGGTGGYGTLFKLGPPQNGSTAWTKSVLLNFTYAQRARFVSRSADGSFYGVSDEGGSSNCVEGCGFVSRIVPQVDSRPKTVAASGAACIEATADQSTATWHNKCDYYVDFAACFGGSNGQSSTCPFTGDFTHLLRYFEPGETRTAQNPLPSGMVPFNQVLECPRGYYYKYWGVIDGTCIKQ